MSFLETVPQKFQKMCRVMPCIFGLLGALWGEGWGGGKGGTIPGLDHSSVLVQQQESSLSGGRRTIQQF